MSSEQFWLVMTEVPDGGLVRLRLRGELDAASAPAVAQRLQSFRDQHTVVLVDLDELAFIDMSGLRMLLAAAEDAARDGWALTVTRGSPPVRRLIDLVHLDRELPFDAGAQ